MQEMQETLAQSLGQEDALEEEMATHSSSLAWRIPWAEEPVGYSPWGFSGKNTRVGCHFLLKGIFLTQELNLCLLCVLHWILLH